MTQPSTGKTSSTAKDEPPWYREGLRFQCTGCGDCCTGAPGYVWINGEDAAALAQHLNLGVPEFLERYARPVGVRKSLQERANGDCVFFDSQSRGCTVYSARPRQCRTWPFWDSNLRTPETWQRTCEVCPGSGTGRLYQLEEIESQRSVIRI